MQTSYAVGEVPSEANMLFVHILYLFVYGRGRRCHVRSVPHRGDLSFGDDKHIAEIWCCLRYIA